jgi:hypothetical protein
MHPVDDIDPDVAITVLMTEFFMDYLRSIYREFDGDFALLMTLGEIGQANVARHVRAMGRDPAAVDRLRAATVVPQEANLAGCSALAAAMASGVPRETARRKVLELEQRGWIAKGDDGHWYATAAAREHFDQSFHRDTLRRLLETADAIRNVMAGAAATRSG